MCKIQKLQTQALCICTSTQNRAMRDDKKKMKNSNIKVLKLHILGLERHILPKITPKMISQQRFIDILMVKRFAHQVYNRLRNQSEQHQDRQQDHAHNPIPNPIPNPSLPEHHQRLKHELDREEADPNHQEHRERHRHLPLDQLLALGHGVQPVALLQHRHHRRQMPDDGDVQEPDQVRNHESDEEEGAEDGDLAEQNGADEEQDQGGDVEGEHDDEVPDEGDDEALPNFGDDGEDAAEGEVPGGVDAGDGVDDGGGGEEGEDDEEDEVGDLEEEEGGELGGEEGVDLVVGAGALGGLVEDEFVVHDFGEEELRDLDVG